MASTPVEIQLPSGLTATLSLYADGSDTLANSGGADTLTEATNRKGLYTATVTEALAGLHFAKVLVGANIVATGWVFLADDTSTYSVVDDKVVASTESSIDAILVDTAELQSDWTNGGRLDLILDDILLDAGTTLPAQITALNNLSASDVNAQVDTALADIHLDHLFAATYDPASKPGVADSLLNELIENDAGVARYTANALEQGPTGGVVIGSGAIEWDVEILISGSPVDGAEVWVTTDVAGANVVAGTLVTNGSGIVTFMLDAGTYYVWTQKGGVNFTNPTTTTVS